jgi:hypothetical protein
VFAWFAGGICTHCPKLQSLPAVRLFTLLLPDQAFPELVLLLWLLFLLLTGEE